MTGVKNHNMPNPLCQTSAQVFSSVPVHNIKETSQPQMKVLSSITNPLALCEKMNYTFMIETSIYFSYSLITATIRCCSQSQS